MENQEASAPVMSVKDWLITYLIMIIPIVGFVMLFVWAFGSDTNPNKANWAKASLIWFVIMIALYFLIFMAFLAPMLASMGQ